MFPDSRNVTLYDDRLNPANLSQPVRIPVTYPGPIKTVRISMPVNNLDNTRILTLCEVEVYQGNIVISYCFPNGSLVQRSVSYTITLNDDQEVGNHI